MIPVDQTIMHDPGNGIHGNCLSATLASLLHLDINDIPVFSDNETWLVDLNAWLKPYGLAMVCQQPDFIDYMNRVGISGLYHDISGHTIRGNEVLHSCIAKDGLVIHDPHPGKNGLVDCNSFGVFITLEPWKQVHGR